MDIQEQDRLDYCPFDPYYHGVGWEQDEDYEPEPAEFDLDRLAGASDKVKLAAMQQWIKEHGKEPAQLQGVPAGLLQLVGCTL